MGCERYIELLSARLDGELNEEEHVELQAHLSRCADCRALAEELSGLDFSALDEIAAPAGFAQGIMKKLRAEETSRVIPLFRRSWFKSAAGIAACAVLCVGLWSALPRDGAQAGMQQNIALASQDGETRRSAEQGAAVPYSLPEQASPETPNSDAHIAGAQAEAIAPEDVAGADEVLILDRLPEGALDLIPSNTAVSHNAETGADTYTWLTAEELSAIEALAFTQGLIPGTSAALPTGAQCALVVLNK